MAEIVDILRLDVDQAIRDVNRVEQALDQALAPVELRIDDTSIQRVESSLRDVRNVAEETTGQVRLTADQYREVARAIELGVDPARAIERATGQVRAEANLAEADFRDLARALDISEDEAQRLTREILESERAAERLEDAARDVARQLDLSEDEANRLTRSLREADVAAGNINTRGSTLVGTFGSLRGAVAGIGGALAVIGGAQVLGGAIRGANAAIQSYAQLVDSINAVNVVFGIGAQAALDFGETAAQSAGLSQTAFNQAVAPLGAVLTNFGFNAKTAADAAVILIQRGADLASVYGGDVQQAVLAINSALVGQVEPLRRYGGEISQARVEQFAFANGIATTREELDQAALVQARVGLILQDTAVVAGDFANTSGDLANAQRIAAAEAQNFASGIGEALAPAMEDLLAVLPGVLDGLQQLVPSLATGAGSAASFFQALGEGGGMREEFASIGAAVGLTTSGLGLLSSASAGLFDVLRGDLRGAGRAFSDFGAVMARNVIRPIQVDLAKALDQGANSVNAVRRAIELTARSTSSFDAFTESFRSFAIQADLSEQELFEVTSGLLEAGAAAGLSVDEIEFLREQYVLLRDALSVVGNEAATAARIMGETEAPFSTITSRFTTFSGDIETAQQRSSTALAQLATDTEAQLGRAAQAFDLFEEAPEALEGTFQAAVDALRTQVEDVVGFEANLALLEALGLDQLEADFREKGAAAAGQLAEAVADIPLAIEANALLGGFAGEVSQGFIDQLIKNLIDFGLTQAEAREIADAFTSPQVIAAAEQAAKSFAGTQTNAYRDGLLSGMDQLEPEVTTAVEDHVSRIFAQEEISGQAGRDTAASFVDGVEAFDPGRRVDAFLEASDFSVDLTDEGIEAGITLITGMVIGTGNARARDRLRDSVVNAVNSALEAQSPSRVMLRAGEAAGEALWAGFAEAEAPTVQLPTVELPDIELPEVRIPEILIPEVVIPDVEIPDVVIPDILLPEVTVPPVTLPEVVIPEIAIPDIVLPDVELPEVTLPEVRIPDILLPDVVLPEVTVPPVVVPDVQIPDVILPDVELPEVRLPDIVIPDIVIPEVTVPPIVIPDVAIPEIVIPDIEVPEVRLPDIVIPDIDIPQVRVPDVVIPDIEIPEVRLPEVVIPDIVIPAVVLPDIAVPGLTLPAWDIPPVDLVGIGRDAGTSFATGVTLGVGDETGLIRAAIEGTVNRAIEAGSPSRMFQRIGEDAGVSFWSGFDQVEIPTVELPDIVIPDIVVPPVVIPDVQVPEIVIPDIDIPEVRLPEIVVPEVDIPDVQIPDVVIPDLVLPEVTLPAVVVPDIEIPEVVIPDIAVPAVILPVLEIPPVDFTDIGIDGARTFTQGFAEEVRRFDEGYNPGDFGFAEGFDPSRFDLVAPEVQFDFDLQALQEQLAALADVTGAVGVEARAALMAGLSTLSHDEITRLRASILDTVNAAIQAGSPSRLFIQIGEDAGVSFWSGFDQAEVATVQLPEIVIPEVEIPPVVIPDVELPEVTIPIPRIADLILPDVTLPDITVPGVDVTAIDLSGVGVDAGISLITGVTVGTAGGTARIRQTILNVLDTALESQSPSRLMRRYGEEAGESFWSGFDEAAAVVVDLPEIVIPEVVIPDIVIPDVVIPDVLLPEVSIPEVVIPDVEIPDVLLPEVVLPEVAVPPIVIPEIDIPDVEIPDITVPQILIPDLLVPDVVLPDITLPDIEIPAIAVPQISIPDIILPDLTGPGIEAGTSLTTGIAAGTTSSEMISRLHVAIQDATNTALEAHSPSQLMLRLGKNAGSDFWAGFDQAELILRTPIQPTTGRVAETVTETVGGNTEINVNLPGLETRDADTTIARASQLLGSVAGILNGNFKL